MLVEPVNILPAVKVEKHPATEGFSVDILSVVLFPGRHLGAEYDVVTLACCCAARREGWVMFPVALVTGM